MISSRDLEKEFGRYGPLEKCKVVLDGKSGLSKKIKVKIGLKKQEALGLMVSFCFGEDFAFEIKLKIFRHHHYFSKE